MISRVPTAKPSRSALAHAEAVALARAAAANIAGFAHDVLLLVVEGDGVDVVEIGQLHPLDFLPDEAFDRGHVGRFLRGHQGEGVAFSLGAAGAADAVNVIFRVLRHVVVDHVAHARHVDAARGDVGGDHHLILAAAETLEGLGPLVLRAVGMHHRDGVLGALEALRERLARDRVVGAEIDAR